MSIRLMSSGAALALALAAAAPAAAQVPVALNHGFANQGSAWQPTAQYLYNRLNIVTLTPTTSWHRPFSEQSAQLRDQLNSWGYGGVVGLAHSNGGLVARNYVQQNGWGSRYDRLATIGTPHHGAPIATSVIQGRPFNFFGSMAMSIAGAFDFYARYDWDFYRYPVVGWITEHALSSMYNVGAFMANHDRFLGLGISAAIPVTWDDRPESGFIAGLNSSGGLGVESSVLWHRVGISTQVNPNLALFSLITSNPRNAKALQRAGAAGALSLYFYYRSHPDWWLASNAWRWQEVYWYLTLMDVAWHDFIGALAYFHPAGFAAVYPSDGFIPHWSSAYPGAYAQYNLNQPYYHISHTEQKDHPSARSRFYSVLRYDFGVPDRYSEPPPPGDGDCGTRIRCIEPY